MPAVERYFPRVRCPFCHGHEFVVQDGVIVPCACRPVQVGEEPPANLRAEVLARVAVTEQERSGVEPANWREESRGQGRVVAVIVGLILVAAVAAALSWWLS